MTAGDAEPFHRTIIMLSGAPGVGKTTIARPLSRALGMPLFAKDSIKERIHDVLTDTGPVDTSWSRRLGAVAMEMLWLLAADAPECLLEANFWAGYEHQNDALRTLTNGGKLVEVYCTAPKEEILRRFDARQARGERHSIHPGGAFDPEDWQRKFGEPVGIGHVLKVDTTKPVDVPRVAAEVRALLG